MQVKADLAHDSQPSVDSYYYIPEDDRGGLRNRKFDFFYITVLAGIPTVSVLLGWVMYLAVKPGVLFLWSAISIVRG